MICIAAIASWHVLAKPESYLKRAMLAIASELHEMPSPGGESSRTLIDLNAGTIDIGIKESIKGNSTKRAARDAQWTDAR